MTTDLIIANIIQQFTGIDASRIVLYNNNFKPPSDPNIYIVVSYSQGPVIANTNKFDDDTNEYIYKTVTADTYNIEITSKNRTAFDRKEEIVMALGSYIAKQYEQDENVAIFRPNSILDLSFIEASSALHRYQISGIIHNIKTVRKSVDYYNQFRTQEVIN